MTSKFFPTGVSPGSLSILRHVHLPPPTPFLPTSNLQSQLSIDFQTSKSFLSLPAGKKPAAASRPFPPPTLLTMEFEPVYTLGRRDRRSLSPPERARLLSTGAKVFETLRGGQTTFHGPGQMTGYIITDLVQHQLTPRCYVSLLEDAMVDTCAHFGVKTVKTENTGVWVTPNLKIGAVGVHMRRNVTSYGVALNVTTHLGWFENIVACGLEGKGTTSLREEGVEVVGVRQVAEVFAEVVRAKLGCGVVEKWEREQLLEWVGGRCVQRVAAKFIKDFVRVTE